MAILAVQAEKPHLRWKLRRAWDSIASWRLDRPIKMRTPLPRSLLYCLVTTATLFALSWDTGRSSAWFQMSVFLRLGFFGLLRPMEALKLTLQQVTLPSQRLLGFAGRLLLAIQDPKNKMYGGRIQFALILDQVTIQWVSWLVDGLPETSKLFTLTSSGVRELLDQLTSFLQLPRFTPASLRAGGATDLFLSGLPLDQLKFRGRWTNVKTLEHYVQEAGATRVLASLKPGVADRLEKILDMYPEGPYPPKVHWSCLFSRSAQLRLQPIFTPYPSPQR